MQLQEYLHQIQLALRQAKEAAIESRRQNEAQFIATCADCGKKQDVRRGKWPITSPSSTIVWRCSQCVHCIHCGARSPGATDDARWNQEYNACRRCHNRVKQRKLCPVCKLVWFERNALEMILCDECRQRASALSCTRLTRNCGTVCGYISSAAG